MRYGSVNDTFYSISFDFLSIKEILGLFSNEYITTSNFNFLVSISLSFSWTVFYKFQIYRCKEIFIIMLLDIH